MPVTNPILQHLNGKQGFKKGGRGLIKKIRISDRNSFIQRQLPASEAFNSK